MRIVFVAGARPNFMKIAPILHAMAEYEEIETLVVHTGQHYDKKMSDIFFEQLDIPEPIINFGIGGGTREDQIEQTMRAFSRFVDEMKPDAVLVVGDVNSTVACSRVAKSKNITIIHVEAGLRSFDQSMPEEVNRIETDQLSDYLFVTEESGMTNLLRERVAGQPFLVGNVMIDTLVRQLRTVQPEALLNKMSLHAKKYVVGTFHRPSNVDTKKALNNVLEIVEYTAARTKFLLPLHPRTRNSLSQYGLLKRLQNHPNVVVSEPLGYADFISAVSQSLGIITDSGGIQEETTFLRIPCITMRENTERPVTVEVGTNVLAGTDTAMVKNAIDDLHAKNVKKGGVPEFWDGRAAPRIVKILVEALSH
jgi:UDP-N-acetylglucosamine 2-epimerase (non-hydrolysing)